METGWQPPKTFHVASHQPVSRLTISRGLRGLLLLDKFFQEGGEPDQGLAPVPQRRQQVWLGDFAVDCELLWLLPLIHDFRIADGLTGASISGVKPALDLLLPPTRLLQDAPGVPAPPRKI
jgi:hypothetical protein